MGAELAETEEVWILTTVASSYTVSNPTAELSRDAILCMRRRDDLKAYVANTGCSNRCTLEAVGIGTNCCRILYFVTAERNNTSSRQKKAKAHNLFLQLI